MTYRIRGTDANGDFDVNRRYSEFDALYAALRNIWPGVFIPPLPDKVFNNKGSTFLEDRKKFLITFLNNCAIYPFIYYSDIFNHFLRLNDTNCSERLKELSAKLTSE